jgi:hypothetical protein
VLRVIAPPGSLAERIASMVETSIALPKPCAIVDAMPTTRAAPLADLTDADFEAGCIAPLADLAAVIADLLPEYRHILLIGTNAGLGDWDVALGGAFAAGAVGLMRSAAMEYAGEGVTLNYLALPASDPALASGAAAIAGALLTAGAVNGQIIVCDGGAHLRMRAARPRSAALPPASPQA